MKKYIAKVFKLYMLACTLFVTLGLMSWGMHHAKDYTNTLDKSILHEATK